MIRFQTETLARLAQRTAAAHAYEAQRALHDHRLGAARVDQRKAALAHEQSAILLEHLLYRVEARL